MLHTKTLHSSAGSSKIAMGAIQGVACWIAKIRADRRALLKAINPVGNSASAVETHLKT